MTQNPNSVPPVSWVTCPECNVGMGVDHRPTCSRGKYPHREALPASAFPPAPVAAELLPECVRVRRVEEQHNVFIAEHQLHPVGTLVPNA